MEKLRTIFKHKFTNDDASFFAVVGKKTLNRFLEYLDKNPNSDGITIRDNVAHDVAMNTFYDALSRMKITYKKRAKI